MTNVLDPVDSNEEEWNKFHDYIDDSCAIDNIAPYEARIIWQIGKTVFRELRYIGAKFTFDFLRSV